MKHFIKLFFVLLASIALCNTYISCSTDGSGSTTNENLVTKTWYGRNNGNWQSKAKWQFIFADCEEISDTEFYIINETRLYFYTDMPSTGSERFQKAELARSQCSNWNYGQITDGYKNSVTTIGYKNSVATVGNKTKFYRQKVKTFKYASIF